MQFLSRLCRTSSNMTPLRSDFDEWRALEAQALKLSGRSIQSLFDEDEMRFDDMHLVHGGLLLDYSKNLVSREIMDSLLQLARACNIEGWRTRMMDGEEINITENRAVRHMDLRKDKPELDIAAVHSRMYEFCARLYDSGQIKNVVNIGIGGSDLGGRMAYMALTPFRRDDINVRFVSNVDGSHLAEALKGLDAKSTLFIVASKSFTTQETMLNARSARAWVIDQGVEDISKHFVALTSNVDEASAFGIDPNSVFPMWDWVGGRFSLWSSIGLPLCIGIGPDHFRSLLKGASSMDEHFVTAPLAENMPVILALIGVWNRNFMGYPALCMAPYDHYMRYFCDYMRQLDMESNGKSVDRDGRRVPYGTGPIVFGEVGTNNQHAFFQLLHQGSVISPCDFIMSKKTQNPLAGHHEKLLVNALAQSQAMMQGQKNEDLHHHFDGNRPSNTIILDELNPFGLGQLLALYEHKVFVQGIIWNINSFDQCGVELGKILALNIEEHTGDLDGSTKGLLAYLNLD